ncbi:hypothetical protein EDD37DRAFT_19822 [Exophiala viscosa]|uniref:uncharacterized protein n=1 Tax=Exophiala viscosa TaxID=2486360 RepID=UPI0021945D9B|nr:hypothetical protein EDD37DRAFT_19822 [Exophiala viscosa]
MMYIKSSVVTKHPLCRTKDQSSAILRRRPLSADKETNILPVAAYEHVTTTQDCPAVVTGRHSPASTARWDSFLQPTGLRFVFLRSTLKGHTLLLQNNTHSLLTITSTTECSLLKFSMASKVYFDRDPLLEFEVFHDLRFPRLRLRTGEIISVGIAARVLHLLKNKHDYSCILCHLKEEFNVEFCAEALEAVLERNFDVTDETLPVGETLIPVSSETNHRGFVKGHVLPSGIYFEIVNLRDSGANFIKQYVSTRWGLCVPENVIIVAINEWVHRMAIANPFIPPPADARPAHDGRVLGELATTADASSSNRSSFANNPPPVYSPPPVYQNARGQRVVLRHPRQVDAIYPEGEAQAPPYSVGNTTPPSYEGVSSIESAESGSLQAAPTHLRPVDEATVSEVSSANNAVTQVPSKPRHSTEETLIKYSRQNVIDYLFDGMHAANIYPVDPFDDQEN